MYKDKQILFANFATKNFELNRKYSSFSALKYGRVDSIIEYSMKDIDSDFYNKNIKIFANSRGSGLWIWKPYIIKNALERIGYGDYLFYCDSGAYVVNDVKLLVRSLEASQQDVMVFELPLLSRQWTKKEAFDLMNFSDYSLNQILASYILIKKTSFSLEIIDEWLENCQNEKLMSNVSSSTYTEFDDFVAHREDQSVWSIVCRKHNIIPFRDPSQYGDWPWEYSWIRSFLSSQDHSLHKKWDLNALKYLNSNYPRILVSNRCSDPVIYQRKICCKNLLYKLGIYNKNIYKLLKNANY